jgi:1,2-beta-oligoglucan phosphorylase
MTPRAARSFPTPGESDLGLRRITNPSGLSLSVLPNGCLFAIEHDHERGRTLINQVLGSPLDGGIARLYLRIRTPQAVVAEAVGPSAKTSFGATADRFSWGGATGGVRHRVSLWLHPQHQLWLWRVEVANTRSEAVACDATLVQDVGLGDRGFLMNNEAYASQYIDHHVARHPRCGPVVMSRWARNGRPRTRSP